MRIKMIAKRKKIGYSQQQVADLIGVKRSTISAWELGRNEPPLEKIILLKTLFQTNDDNIFLDYDDTKRRKVS